VAPLSVKQMLEILAATRQRATERMHDHEAGVLIERIVDSAENTGAEMTFGQVTGHLDQIGARALGEAPPETAQAFLKKRCAVLGFLKELFD
jgi:hypothetical protein